MGKGLIPIERHPRGRKGRKLSLPPLGRVTRMPGTNEAFKNFNVFSEEPHVIVDLFRRQAILIRFNTALTKPFVHLTIDAVQSIKTSLSFHAAKSQRTESRWRKYWASLSRTSGLIKAPKDTGENFLSDLLEILRDPKSYVLRPETAAVCAQYRLSDSNEGVTSDEAQSTGSGDSGEKIPS